MPNSPNNKKIYHSNIKQFLRQLLLDQRPTQSQIWNCTTLIFLHQKQGGSQNIKTLEKSQSFLEIFEIFKEKIF